MVAGSEAVLSALGAAPGRGPVSLSSGLFDHPTATRYELAEDSADGVFTARADLAASMLREVTEKAYVRRATGSS